jgi:hypothetical protein
MPQLDVDSNGNVGEFDLTGSGTITATLSSAGQDNSSWDESVSMTYRADATASGTGSFLTATDTTDQASCAVLTATKLVCVSQTDSAPTVELVEQN